MKLIVICAWCGGFIRLKNSQQEAPLKHPISYGICRECKEEVMMELEEFPPQNQNSINI